MIYVNNLKMYIAQSRHSLAYVNTDTRRQISFSLLFLEQALQKE